MSRFISKEAGRLAPYTPGEQPQDQQYVKLNTNESPFPPSPKVLEALSQAEISKLNLYSDPTCGQLVKAIAKRYGLQPENVITGNGSDEILAFAFRAFCGEGRGLAYADITYGFYKSQVALFGLDAKVIPLREDFTLNVEDYLGLGATVVIANPNAPTGLALKPAQIERLLQADPDHVVIVDEAYVDFGAESCVPLVEKYPNLLVVQTFSKSRNLAGARLGFAIGSEDLIADLNRVKFSYNPYNINRLTLLAGTAAMEDEAYFEECTGKVRASRQWTAQALKKLGFTVLDSNTNFLFAASSRMEGGALYRALKQEGILVRHFDAPRISNYLRITIGTQQEMETLIAALEKLGA